MANIRKSFNFKTGLQVDNDNFVINSNGLVGIGTSVPQGYLFNVYGDSRVTGLVTTATLHAGVGTVTTLVASNSTLGVTTVTSLKVGTSVAVTNLIGYGFTAWTTNDGGVGLTTSARIGIGTTATPSEQLKVFGDANVTGVITATSFTGNVAATNLTGTINNARLPSAISVTSVTANSFIGTATAASSVVGTPDISVGIVTATDISVTSVSATNTTVSGVSTVTSELNVGAGGTALTSLNTGRLGIGTAVPGSELQIRKASGSLLEVVSDSGQARVSVGQSVGVGNSTGVLRFGTNANTFDLLNNDTGDIRNIIHAGSAGVSTGNFKWIYGQTNAERMTLTWDGNLGVNQSTPTHRLHVVGTSTVTGNAWVGGNLNVAGNITGTISYPLVINNSNLNNTSGVTTLSQLVVSDDVNFNTATFVGLGTVVGINTTNGAPGFGLDVQNGIQADRLDVTGSGGINANTGIVTAQTFVASAGFRVSTGSTQPVQIEYASSPDRVIFTVVGIGSTSLQLF
jgi:hypothetical protein